MSKKRQCVDTSVHALAAEFLKAYMMRPTDVLIARQDAEWDLAQEIQTAIEDWLEYEVSQERITEI